jgi:hypothetical protein
MMLCPLFVSNPDFPSGTQKRVQLYEAYPSLKTPLSGPELTAVRAVGDKHFAALKGPSAWQLDPLTSQELRDKRAATLALMGSMSLADEYKAHRHLTRHFRGAT